MLTHKTLPVGTDRPGFSGVTPSLYAEEHLFSGGTQGAVLVKNSLNSDGSAWVATIVGVLASSSINGIPTFTATLPSAVQTNITALGAVGAGSITPGFGSIDVGADAISGGAITGTSGTFTDTVSITKAGGTARAALLSNAGTATTTIGNDFATATLRNPNNTVNNYNGIEFESNDSGGTVRIAAGIYGVYPTHGANFVDGKFILATRVSGGVMTARLTVDGTGTTLAGTLASGAVTASVATSISALVANQTSTGDVQIGLTRAGGTASSWFMYIPTGSTNLRLFSGADRFIFTAAGALSFASDLTINTNKFTVAGSTGNTVVAGTLGVTGVATLTAQPIVSSLTASLPVFTDGSKGLVSNTMTGTGSVVMSASPTLTGNITAVDITASGTITAGILTVGGIAPVNILSDGASQIIFLNATTLGTGNKPGPSVVIGRNASGSGAAGTLSLFGRSGTRYWLWVDATGVLRIGTAAPEEDNSPSDTSGTVVGTQT